MSIHLRVSNGLLEVSYDDPQAGFSARSAAQDGCFLEDSHLLTAGECALVVDTILDGVVHPRFGEGQAIRIVYSNGAAGQAALYEGSPFVFISSTLTNASTETITLNHVKSHALGLASPHPTGDLKAYGTAGLTAADGHPGSYAYLAVVHPESRNGIVGGWLTHDRASGIVFSRKVGHRLRMDGQLDYGCLRVAPSGFADTEVFIVGYFDDARMGLEAYADAVVRMYDIQLPPQPVTYCTWYHAWSSSNEVDLAKQIPLAAKELVPFGLSVAQIDDRWQLGQARNGPAKNFTGTPSAGDGSSACPFPSGMKAQAAAIEAYGLCAGLWMMPFAGDHLDPLYSEHQDWFVHRADGSPYETEWGGTCLDMTHPGAQEHLRTTLQRICSEWGYRYLKLDGLWTGTGTDQKYVNTGYVEDGIGTASFHNPAKTNIEAFRDGLKLIAQTAGDSTFRLGCCTPQNMRSFGGAFGLVHAMRIGPDNGSTWPQLMVGAEFGSRHYFLHGRVWYNDPDPVYVRATMPIEHARLMASWAAISGQLTTWSEWLPDVPPDRLDILKRTMPSHGLLPRPVDLFEHVPPRAWLLTDDRGLSRRCVLAFFNWDEAPQTLSYKTSRLGLSEEAAYIGFDYWGNRLIAPFRGRLEVELAPRSCSVISVRPACRHPQLISTSRHITQGIVDVRDEEWNACSGTLHGTSSIVCGDPYELRVHTTGRWALLGICAEGTDADDPVAELESMWSEVGDVARIVLRVPRNMDVRWSLTFRETV